MGWTRTGLEKPGNDCRWTAETRFSLDYGRSPTRRRWLRVFFGWLYFLYTIYTSQNLKNHAEILFFYKIEQKGLFIETYRENSTFFATERKLPLYDIYEVKSQISRMKNKKGYWIFTNCDGQLNFSAPDCKKYFLQSEHIRDVRKKFILSTLINLRIRQLVKKIN